MRIAIMGSAFNPPTLGHVDVIAQALRHAEQVWLVPSFHHAWGKTMAAYLDRCAMSRRLARDIGDPRVQLMAIEHLIASERPVYSIDVMDWLQQRLPTDQQLLLVLGPDNASAFDKFHRAAELQARWPLLLADERRPIRSTQLRQRLEQGRSIEDLTTPAVAAYLKQHPLYTRSRALADS